MLHKSLQYKSFSDGNRQLFQVYPPIINVRYVDIRDALEVSKNLRETDKKHYFASLGIDYIRVQQYYPKVLQMEKQLHSHDHTISKETMWTTIKEIWRVTCVVAGLSWLILISNRRNRYR